MVTGPVLHRIQGKRVVTWCVFLSFEPFGVLKRSLGVSSLGVANVVVVFPRHGTLVALRTVGMDGVLRADGVLKMDGAQEALRQRQTRLRNPHSQTIHLLRRLETPPHSRARLQPLDGEAHRTVGGDQVGGITMMQTRTRTPSPHREAHRMVGGDRVGGTTKMRTRTRTRTRMWGPHGEAHRTVGGDWAGGTTRTRPPPRGLLIQ